MTPNVVECGGGNPGVEVLQRSLIGLRWDLGGAFAGGQSPTRHSSSPPCLVVDPGPRTTKNFLALAILCVPATPHVFTPGRTRDRSGGDGRSFREVVARDNPSTIFRRNGNDRVPLTNRRHHGTDT